MTLRTINGYGAKVGYQDRCFLQEENQDYSPLTEESLAWLQQHGGPRWQSEIRRMWGNTSSDDDGVIFYFDDPQTALLFKLTWGGQ